MFAKRKFGLNVFNIIDPRSQSIEVVSADGDRKRTYKVPTESSYYDFTARNPCAEVPHTHRVPRPQPTPIQERLRASRRKVQLAAQQLDQRRSRLAERIRERMLMNTRALGASVHVLRPSRVTISCISSGTQEDAPPRSIFSPQLGNDYSATVISIHAIAQDCTPSISEQTPTSPVSSTRSILCCPAAHTHDNVSAVAIRESGSLYDEGTDDTLVADDSAQLKSDQSICNAKVLDMKSSSSISQTGDVTAVQPTLIVTMPTPERTAPPVFRSHLPSPRLPAEPLISCVMAQGIDYDSKSLLHVPLIDDSALDLRATAALSSAACTSKSSTIGEMSLRLTPLRRRLRMALGAAKSSSLLRTEPALPSAQQPIVVLVRTSSIQSTR